MGSASPLARTSRAVLEAGKERLNPATIGTDIGGDIRDALQFSAFLLGPDYCCPKLHCQ